MVEEWWLWVVACKFARSDVMVQTKDSASVEALCLTQHDAATQAQGYYAEMISQTAAWHSTADTDSASKAPWVGQVRSAKGRMATAALGMHQAPWETQVQHGHIACARR